MMIWSEASTNQSPVTVTVNNQKELLADLESRFDREEGFCVATLNLDHVVKLASDSPFSIAYRQHTHITADGNPIVWLARLAGQSAVSLVPGSELIAPLSEIASRKSVSIALVGATQDTLATTSAKLKQHYPSLDVVLEYAPEMGFDPYGEAAADAITVIGQSKARLVFLALGAPKQEQFAARAFAARPDIGFLSIGAGLDFLSGAQTRAPKWVRMLAAEWLWRLCLNPKRLARRYGACLVVLPRLMVRALIIRQSSKT